MIYEYECQECNRVFERWSCKARDMRWTELCPDCSGVGHRIISQTSFVLKGEGWYRDGYQKGKQNSKSHNDSKPSSTDRSNTP